MSDLAYKTAITVMAGWILEFARKPEAVPGSYPAQGGSVPGCPPQPGQVHPEAGVTNPPILLVAPAGATSSSLQAKTITDGSANHCSAG